MKNEPNSAPPIGRKYSVMSESALSNLDNIELNMDTFTKEMLTIDEEFNSIGEAAGLVVLKNQLIQLMGNIEKLQFNELDAVVTGDLTSGKDATKIRRKKLNSDVSGLQQTCQSLFDDISQKIVDLQPK